MRQCGTAALGIASPRWPSLVAMFLSVPDQANGFGANRSNLSSQRPAGSERWIWRRY